MRLITSGAACFSYMPGRLSASVRKAAISAVAARSASSVIETPSARCGSIEKILPDEV